MQSTLTYFFQSFSRIQLIKLLNVFKSTFGEGYIYLRGLFIIFFVDAIISDDEPI
jgi:hypothetical protein